MWERFKDSVVNCQGINGYLGVGRFFSPQDMIKSVNARMVALWCSLIFTLKFVSKNGKLSHIPNSYIEEIRK
jgi:hypothetical protein